MFHNSSITITLPFDAIGTVAGPTEYEGEKALLKTEDTNNPTFLLNDR
jgi:hypothetical protein